MVRRADYATDGLLDNNYRINMAILNMVTGSISVAATPPTFLPPVILPLNEHNLMVVDVLIISAISPADNSGRLMSAPITYVTKEITCLNKFELCNKHENSLFF